VLTGLRPSEVTSSGASRARHRSTAPAGARWPDGAPVHYERHRPERTTLYRLVPPHGKTLDIVGESGSGKTTLAMVLLAQAETTGTRELMHATAG